MLKHYFWRSQGKYTLLENDSTIFSDDLDKANIFNHDFCDQTLIDDKNVELSMTTSYDGMEFCTRAAFTKIKKILTIDPILKYFDVNKEVTISWEASQSGLGSVLFQDNKPVAYASRSVTDAETRYAQIEKELLAIPWDGTFSSIYIRERGNSRQRP